MAHTTATAAIESASSARASRAGGGAVRGGRWAGPSATSSAVAMVTAGSCRPGGSLGLELCLDPVSAADRRLPGPPPRKCVRILTWFLPALRKMAYMGSRSIPAFFPPRRPRDAYLYREAQAAHAADHRPGTAPQASGASARPDRRGAPGVRRRGLRLLEEL